MMPMTVVGEETSCEKAAGKVNGRRKLRRAMAVLAAKWNAYARQCELERFKPCRSHDERPRVECPPSEA